MRPALIALAACFTYHHPVIGLVLAFLACWGWAGRRVLRALMVLFHGAYIDDMVVKSITVILWPLVLIAEYDHRDDIAKELGLKFQWPIVRIKKEE